MTCQETNTRLFSWLTSRACHLAVIFSEREQDRCWPRRRNSRRSASSCKCLHVGGTFEQSALTLVWIRNTLDLSGKVHLPEWGDKITSVTANNWTLCGLALPPERYATLTASTSLLDKHCAFHCVSKRAADSVLPPGSDTFASWKILFKCDWAMTGNTKDRGCTICNLGRVIFFYVAGCKIMWSAPRLMSWWPTSLVWFVLGGMFGLMQMSIRVNTW